MIVSYIDARTNERVIIKDVGSWTDESSLYDPYILRVIKDKNGNDVGYKMDDALYLFAVLGLKPTKYDLVCCDEAQDFNICQIRMVERFAQQGSRVVFVGDPNQSIYAFRGSCTTAFA